MKTRLLALLSLAALTTSLATGAHAAEIPAHKASPKAEVARLQAKTGPPAFARNIEVAPEVGMTGPIAVQAGLDRIWDLGVAWKDVNPAPGFFDFKNLDLQIAAAEAAGFKPMLVLGLTPTWAAKDPNAGDPRWGLGTASAPAQMSYWTDYITAVVQRYGARIAAYEVWNEANLQTFWAGTPQEMAQLTKSANTIIKAANPQARTA